MDLETGKLLISVLSAVVAVAGAALAFRARFQTRADIFESQRDALVLAMAENDNRCNHISLQCAFSRAELERVMPAIAKESDREQANAYLANIVEIENLTKVFDRREYNADKVDALIYNEEALATLRRMARGEQVNSKHLHAASYDFIFGQIDRFIERREAKT